MNTADLNKSSLRSLCRAHGITGYGNMTNADMRAALAALDADADKSLELAVGDASAAPAAQPAAPAEVQPAAPAAKTERARRPRGEVSVKQWIAYQLAAGPLAVKDLMAFVASTGRSSVTAHRQVRELGYCCRKGMVVKAAE